MDLINQSSGEKYLYNGEKGGSKGEDAMEASDLSWILSVRSRIFDDSYEHVPPFPNSMCVRISLCVCDIAPRRWVTS